jgi:hypothetical protein
MKCERCRDIALFASGTILGPLDASNRSRITELYRDCYVAVMRFVRGYAELELQTAPKPTGKAS